ncbi:STAS domain-containing protein [Candidatus Uabimicrobium sp. HlEnr_7]|uniref:STAS domain-containing protein n=1 Tax=Candidatus Uabimicrobium helgolandensis TaxID=3095367 RepID=UPI0035575F53
MAKVIVKGSVGDTDIIEISEEVTEKYVSEVRNKFLVRLRSNVKNIILLCKNIKRVDSSGASLLAEISSEVKKNGGKLFLVNCPSSVKILINFMGMDHLCEFHTSEEDVCSILNISHQDFLFSATGRALKRQIILEDSLRNKKINLQYNQTMTVASMIEFLKKQFIHLRNINVCLEINSQPLPSETTVIDIFNKYNYSQKNIIYIIKESPSNDDFPLENPTEKLTDNVYGDFGTDLINSLGEAQQYGLTGEGTVVDEPITEEQGLQEQVEIKDDLLCTQEIAIEVSGTLSQILEQALVRIRKIEKTLEFVLELSNSFSKNKNLKESLKRLMETIYNFEDYGYGVVLLYNRKTGKLETKCIINNEEDSFQKTMISKRLIQETEEKRSLIIATHETSNRIHISMPILSGKQLLGIIYLIGIPNKKYIKEKLLMLSTITNYGALAIENTILIEELESSMSTRNSQ